jgi:sensor c-di-GMP phosphodiesterase-like protein
MPTFRQRIFTTFTVTVCAAVFGVFLGYFVARTITVQIMQMRLDNYASRLVTDEEAAAAELRTSLAAVNASAYKACSPFDVGYFRALIFESDLLKDAGRVGNGQILCSAVLARPTRLLLTGDPSFTQQDGTTIYKQLTPYMNSGLETIALARDGAYVVYSPLTRLHLEPAPMHFVETVTDAPTQQRGRLLGDASPANPHILSTEGKAQLGDTLFATHCSIRFFDCVTTYVSLPEAIHANRGKFTNCIALVAACCAIVGLLLSLLYRRNKGIEQQLRRAVRRKMIRVVYQPIVDLRSGNVVGAEALARWTDEDDRHVSPEVFIRIAEERGYVGEITRLVLRQVLRDFATIFKCKPDFRVSINVTASDLEDSSFPLMLEQTLALAAVPPSSITIEITESSTVRQQVAIEAIRRLREKGHKVHIDDFGTGYSSLAYLQDLAVDAIKIDRAFTKAIGTGSVTTGILPQILAMVETLHLNVIVEGVETEQQAAYFSTATLPVLAQGWLFGRPQTFADFITSQARREIYRAESTKASTAKMSAA